MNICAIIDAMKMTVTATQDTMTQTNVMDTTLVDYRAAIDVVTSYIQSQIEDDLRLDDLAVQAGFSPFHFHRIFAGVMGETVADYVQRIRMAMVVQRLLQTNEPVTEIGLAAGYKTPSAFAKAFRLRFGVSPTTFRTMDRQAAYALLIQNPLAASAAQRLPQPEIRTLPDLQVLYARGWGMIEYSFSKAADRAFATLISYLQRHKLMDAFSACLAITPDNYDVVPHEQCRIDAGVVLKAGVQVELASDEVAIQVLPAGRWAVFIHKGPYDTLWQSWNVAYRDWLPRSNERPRDVPPVEIYLNNINNTPPEQLRTEILIPIV
jgi:AraC family transcriptional regulator